ncbi:hypothetical protein ACFQ5N_04720 [Lutibacter holmesii]|uniref:Transporter n=1 Tax=Lutibacter holmesii TaxID=1137985 RepID=A0ABW3WLW4_9FLAO
MKKLVLSFVLLLFVVNINTLKAQNEENTGHSAEKLAKQLANPVASLISVPLQNNFDFNLGAFNGFRYNVNLQPVIPISINEKWNLISRTILPFISQNDVTAIGTNQTGLGDTTQSIFFSPKEVKNGMVWGTGVVLTIPTATNNLGSKKWGAGPNLLILKLQGQWTYGALANHIWSYAGSGTNDISNTFFQPFLTYANKSGASFTIASENTQSWDSDTFSGFAGVYFSKVLKFGKQMMQLGGGPKIYYGNNPLNPEWGIRANIILLFPK